MATAKVSDFLRRLTRGMTAQRLADQADRELVQRLLAGPDEAAFEALVRRHGPMVYRVCWRVLQQAEDCEDAFQATFLLLARKLPGVRRRDSLASWLHGVAHRVALDARKQAARRRRHEGSVPVSRPEPPDDITWKELRTVLDAELASLAEKHRLPLILCYLEGRTQDEAARALGWSKSTLRRRLEEGRAALGRRLTRKGVVWPAAISAVLLSDCVAPAALSLPLVGSTVEAARCALAGGAAVGTVSAKVITLVEGVGKAMFVSQWKSIAAIVLFGGALVAGGLAVVGNRWTATAAAQAPPADPKAGLVKAPPGVPADVRKPIVVHEAAQVAHVAWSADGKAVATVGTAFDLVDGQGANGPIKLLSPRSTIKLWSAATGKLLTSLGGEQNSHITAIAFAPDRKHLAVAGWDVRPNRPGPPGDFVRILDATTGAVKYELDEDDRRGVGAALAFSPDGRTLALGGSSPLVEKGSVVKLWDLRTQKMTTAAKFAAAPRALPAPIPGKPPEWLVACLVFAPDGKTLAAGEWHLAEQRAQIQLYDPKTGEPKRAWRLGAARGLFNVAFTADGKSLVSACGALKLWDPATGDEQKLFDTRGAEVFQVAVAPDGRHLATTGLRTENGRSVPEVCLWSARTGGLLRTITWKDPAMWSSCIAFSRDGSTLAVGTQTDADVRVKGSERVKGELRLIPLGR